MRAKIVLMASQGVQNKMIAERLSLPVQVVSKWQKRFFEKGLAVVYGAGAIGGLVGHGIAGGGEDVLMVDIVPEHVEAMNTNGLRVKSAAGEQTVPVRAALSEALRGPLGIEAGSRPMSWLTRAIAVAR